MFRKLLVSAALTAALVAGANASTPAPAPVTFTITTSTDGQPQLVQSAATSASAPAVTEPASTAATIREARLFAEALGDGLFNIATRLGIAVNDFLKTPVGTAIAAGLLLKFFGGLALKVVFLAFSVFVATMSLRRAIDVGTDRKVVTKYEYRSYDSGLMKVLGLKYKHPLEYGFAGEKTSGASVAPALIGVVFTIMSLVVVLNF